MHSDWKTNSKADIQHDHLSALWNKETGEQLLTDCIRTAKAQSTSFLVVLLDINDLHTINKNCGHQEGDRVLQRVAEKIRGSLQTGDFAIRLGGDEFLLVFKQLSKKEARNQLYQLQSELHTESKELPYVMGFCFGMTRVDPDMELSLKKIIMRADDEMYVSKRRYHMEKSRQAFALHPYHESEEVRQFSYDKDLLLSALMQSSDDYIYVCNMKEDPSCFRYSRAMVEEFDLPSEIVHDAANVWGSRIHEADQKLFLEGNQEIADGRVDSHNVEYRARNCRGEWVWLRCRGHVERDEDGQPVLFAGIITNLGRKNKIDYLSGQFNKYELEDALQMMVSKEEHFYMMILDLDEFSSVNKLYNHQFGDAVLAKTAQLIQSVLPEQARLYRNDGDEFIILFRDCVDSRDISECYQRLQKELDHQRVLNGKKYHCTVSAGCADFPKDATDMMALTKNAGYALDASKRNGKNRLTFYEKKMSETKLQELDMLEQLRYCMEHEFEGFQLQYQPQVEAESGRIIGAEALARWHSSLYGDVSPVVFIPLLEKSGMILTIGRWIFETAVKQCAVWLKSCPDFCVSVNLSYLQLYEEGFTSFMKETMERCQVPSRNIIVEMTESYMVKSSEELQAIFQEIRGIGVRIAMDDFGTGYSSLGVLKNSPADIVKIDRIFIKDILNSEFDATFIQFVVRLCHDVNIQVLLEGVETKEEYEKVKAMGLDYIQGYYFGKPMQAEALKALL